MAEKPKRSFFERLTGAVNMEHLDEEEKLLPSGKDALELSLGSAMDDSGVGQLGVDVYQTPDSIVVKAMVAGVKPEDLDVSISRDSITVRGRRMEDRTVTEGDYQLKELYWGEFARTVALPVEVEADQAEASEKHGLLIIKIPKIDKNRQTKLRVRAV